MRHPTLENEVSINVNELVKALCAAKVNVTTEKKQDTVEVIQGLKQSLGDKLNTCNQ